MREDKRKVNVSLRHLNYNRSTCSWKSSNYVGLLQCLADRLTTESTGVQRAQEGSRATAQIVCCLVLSHRAIWQHSHIQLSVLHTVKNLQETRDADHPGKYLHVPLWSLKSNYVVSNAWSGTAHSLATLLYYYIIYIYYSRYIPIKSSCFYFVGLHECKKPNL